LNGFRPPPPFAALYEKLRRMAGQQYFRNGPHFRHGLPVSRRNVVKRVKVVAFIISVRLQDKSSMFSRKIELVN
jgi:hypothetical protein